MDVVVLPTKKRKHSLVVSLYKMLQKEREKKEENRASKTPLMATFNLSFLLLIFILLFNLHNINSSTCNLNFSRFPYEPHGECFAFADDNTKLLSDLTMQTCCRSALQSIFQAMSIRFNQSQSRSSSIFLEQIEARDCIDEFQNLHNETHISKCELQNFISNSNPRNSCNVVGGIDYDLQSNCEDLLATGRDSSDDACFNCLMSYRQSVRILRDEDDEEDDGCSESSVLISLASSNVDSLNWVHNTFSCLFDEIRFSLPGQNRKKGSLLDSKTLIVIVVVAACLVVITPILYQITTKQLQDSSQKDIENLSVIVLKTLEDESKNLITCSDLYIFSQDEVAKATNYFNNSNLIAEVTIGKIYIAIMPSGMRAAIKKINDRVVNLHDYIDEICRKAKIRHPNLVGIMGYCDRGDHQCLVYEYCVNGNLANLLMGEHKTRILTWEQRLHISIGIARGLWYLHNNPLEKTVHGGVKSTNILLNEKLEAKLLDSFLSKKKSNETTSRSESMANDVFDFGVVLLQILTGRKSKSLVDEAREILSKGGSASAMADPRLNGEYVSAEFHDILSLVVLCTTPNKHQRPNMEEVLRKLEKRQLLV